MEKKYINKEPTIFRSLCEKGQNLVFVVLSLNEHQTQGEFGQIGGAHFVHRIRESGCVPSDFPDLCPKVSANQQIAPRKYIV